MHTPIPGGSVYRIEFGDELIEVNLPPVGYVVDKIPDPKTGKPSEKLIKSEILFDDLPLKEKRWTKPELPKNWDKWIEEEQIQRQLNPEWSHPDADYFRAQEWRRRINGVWMAIGNNSGKPVEYVYLTGFAYFYLAWWFNGYRTNFRFVLLRIFYALEWAEENPKSYGVIMSTLRRLGKTAIAFAWYFELCSRRAYRFGGMQAQTEKIAKEYFERFLIKPFLFLPEFFIPNHNSRKYVSGLFFSNSKEKDRNKKYLNSDLTFRETKSNAYDKAKLNRYIVEEPGKWDEEDIYSTFRKVKPALTDGPYIIGKAFLPTTIEELQAGGDAFIRLFEDSLPSKMKKNNGDTVSGLIALFIPAFEGYIFDQYGRSVVNDPDPKEELYDDLTGKRILEGAKTVLLRRRKLVEHDPEALSTEMRQFPFTWEEAKSMSYQFCHFNAMVIQRRLDFLHSLVKPKYVLGNLEWTNGVDSDVEFFRDDYRGRWKFTWLPDAKGDGGDAANKHRIVNNVITNWDSDIGKKIYSPANDHLFAMGVDPMRNIATDDPKASKGAAYVMRKYDALADTGKDIKDWTSYKFIVEYINRPEDPNDFHEDMIKTCRYFSVSMFEEGNIETLRQHFISRGYGPFLVNRGHFSDDALPGVKKDGANADKPVRTDEIVTHNLVNKLKTYFNKHVDKIDFPELLEAALKFRIKKHFKKDAIFGAGYTVISAEREFATPSPDKKERPLELEIFPVYDQGTGEEVDVNELIEWNS